MGRVATLLFYLPVLLLSVTVHEYAHARVAVGQGDPTPELQGRLTLNPLRHLDPFGSLLVPLLLYLSQAGFLFGWARPVEVNPHRYEDPRRGDILVSAAGVVANFALALVFLMSVVGAVHLLRALDGEAAAVLAYGAEMARFGVALNLLLAVFNLLPVPPLDGSHLLYHALPPGLGARYREVGKYGVLLLVAAFFVPGLLGVLLYPVRVLDGWAETLIRTLA